MEESCVKDLLDIISQLSLFFSRHDVASDFVRKSFQDVEDILKYLRPILEIITTCDFSRDEGINLLLEELKAVIAKTRELAVSWHQMTSKLYFVLQFETIVNKLQTNLIVTCDAICAFLQSLGMQSSSEMVELCASEARDITGQQISAIIKDSIQDQMKNVLPSAGYTSKIEECLSLSTNQELLVEVVALDKLKSEIAGGDNLAEVEYIDHMIALVSFLHDCYVDKHQLHRINDQPVPADFCCPLSLDLMSDPVIVASGQTYERSFIRKWLDQGFTVCPKTRQTLGHMNLIPNYTVKALIASWCETYNINLPNPVKNLNDHEYNLTSDQKMSPHPRSPESDGDMINSSRKSHLCNGFPQGTEQNDKFVPSTQHSPVTNSSLWAEEGSAADSGQSSPAKDEADVSGLENKDADSVGQLSNHLDSSHLDDVEAKGDSRRNSAYSNAGQVQGTDVHATSRLANDASNDCNDASGETKPKPPASVVPSRAPELLPRLGELRLRNQAIWRRASDRFSPRIISSSMDMRPDLSGVETQVRKLIEDLKGDSLDEQRNAAMQLRLLAKHNVQNRIVIANCGAITHLVSLLHSSDEKIQENAVTALLNLSIDDNNKISIANADAIDPLIDVLKTGSPEAKENSAATLYSLSVNEQNKARVGRSGAIIPLVDLLANGTPRGKRDAATALFNLSIFHGNKARIVQAGAVRHLVKLMDPAAGMVDKAVAVLSNLSTIPEGRSAIGRENGIPVLVEVVELGSGRGKENAAAALLQLCTSSSRFCNMVLQEGAVPPLVALSKSGTPRGKEKAQSLLGYFRNQRHGNSRRR